ncbi:unnamed protein product [Didymodactylos carnosus]|uniref:NEDD8 ultimate buster 1 n=1 Tax=Didymodactylos carnosus TaxID=1234261 RepID=A0A8S2CZX2_9BILA|nr:unnamed protein product [Didymodactylos carnosus]CAF3589115.1 unnamed protein product [Didymodactylos carnosus]
MSANTSEVDKEVNDLIRTLLNRDKVKLWEEPYTTKDGKENIPQELVQSICAETGIPDTVIHQTLTQLRLHALEKLAVKKEQQQKDLIKIKIRSSSETQGSICTTLDVPYYSTGQQLVNIVKDKLSLQDSDLKLICSGRVLNFQQTLQAQNIKENATILVIHIPKSEVALTTASNINTNLVEAVRQAAEILNQNVDLNNPDIYQLNITDQNGRELRLPENERRSLTLAMTLHEKGRSFLKNHEYLSALTLFCEADNEFRQYASERLRRCDECFTKCYGNSLKRLLAVEKDGQKHVVLFVRLHLLQAIVAYHAGRKVDAKNLLDLAATELNSMKVDNEKLTQVMLMGYSDVEARLGLRASMGNIERAIDHILERRRTKQERAEAERQRIQEQHIQSKYGKTQNGNWIDVQKFKNLVQMGYSKRSCAEALKQTNNNLEQALEALLTNPDVLLTAAAASRQPLDIFDDLEGEEDGNDVNNTQTVSDEHVSHLANLGFEPESAKLALEIESNNLENAANYLMQNSDISELRTKAQAKSAEKAFRRLNRGIRNAANEQQRRLLDTVINDISKGDADEYLHTTLDEEEAFIKKYRNLLNNSY